MSENADLVEVEKSANMANGENADFVGVKKSAKEADERKC